jgi:hypothetical protein
MIAPLLREGFTFSARGQKLRVEGPEDLVTSDLLAALTGRKAELLAAARGDFGRATGELLIRSLLEGRIGEDEFWAWEEWCMERAAIAEYQGGMSPREANAVAYELLSRELERLSAGSGDTFHEEELERGPECWIANGSF